MNTPTTMPMAAPANMMPAGSNGMKGGRRTRRSKGFNLGKMFKKMMRGGQPAPNMGASTTMPMPTTMPTATMPPGMQMPGAMPPGMPMPNKPAMGGRRRSYTMRGGKGRMVGTKAQVWHGTADHTVGGLKKKDLMKHKGRIVSRKKHALGKKAFKKLVKAGYKPKKGTFKLFRK